MLASDGLSDSHYELSAVFEDTTSRGDEGASTHWSTRASLDDEQYTATFEPAAADGLLANPWFDAFIDSWSRYHCMIALGFGTSSLAVLGFLLVRALWGGAVIDSSITALIVGCVMTVAFMLLSVSATVLVALLVDLGRSLRQLLIQSNRGVEIASE
jgi:hypothetical protein